MRGWTERLCAFALPGLCFASFCCRALLIAVVSTLRVCCCLSLDGALAILLARPVLSECRVCPYNHPLLSGLVALGSAGREGAGWLETNAARSEFHKVCKRLDKAKDDAHEHEILHTEVR